MVKTECVFGDVALRHAARASLLFGPPNWNLGWLILAHDGS